MEVLADGESSQAGLTYDLGCPWTVVRSPVVCLTSRAIVVERDL
jgi:hypothetical protein